MNWKIAFSVWLKGLGIFAIGCIMVGSCSMFNGSDFPVLCEGLTIVIVDTIAVVVVASIISSPAILLYAMSLHLVKRTNMSYKSGIVFLIIAASIAVSLVDFVLYLFGASFKDAFGYFFRIPLLFCIASILISRKSIWFYLHPIKAFEAFIIE